MSKATLSVYKISLENGKFQGEWIEASRKNILKIARSTTPEMEQNRSRVRLSFSIPSGRGSQTQVHIPPTLQYRDLRFLDFTNIHMVHKDATQAFGGQRNQRNALTDFTMRENIKTQDGLRLSNSKSNPYRIIVRWYSILIQLFPITALLTHNECYLVCPRDQTAFVESINSIFDTVFENRKYSGDDAFVFTVLEGIFVHISESLSMELKALTPEIRDSINTVTNTSRGAASETLRQVNFRMESLLLKLQSYRTAFEEVLKSDVDLALMKLGSIHAHPSHYEPDNHVSWVFEHEEVEYIVESYQQDLDGIIYQAQSLHQELDIAQASTALKLDNARNNLIYVQILVESTLAVALLCTVVPGLFAMNLSESEAFHNNPNLFWPLSAVLVFLVPVGLVLIRLWLFKSGVLIQ